VFSVSSIESKKSHKKSKKNAGLFKRFQRRIGHELIATENEGSILAFFNYRRQEFFQMKRKVKITFEIEELTFFKVRKILTAHCEFCGLPVELLPIEIAVSLPGLSEAQISRLIKSGSVHFIETDKVYLCRNSLETRAEILKTDLEKFGHISKDLADKK
jgi:hypothetical protein